MIPFLKRFKEVVSHFPDRAAVVDLEGSHSISYQDLNKYSDKVAAYLRHLGIGKEDVVGIYFPKGMEYIAARLGVIKAGAAWVALEDMMGQERISYVVEDSDARLTLLSARAVRIMALAAVPMSLTYLLTSYYLYQEHFVFSMLGTAFSNFFFQILLAVPCGLIWGLGGVWAGISAGIYVGLGVLLLLVLLQYGISDFPLLLFDQDRVIKDFNFDLTSDSIVSVRNKANEFLAANNVSYKNINLVDLAIEEIFMLVLEMNKGKRLMGECTLSITDRIELIVWDDGLIFDITDTDQQVTSLRKYVVANIMQYIKGKKTITATGLNRNAFSFIFEK